MRDHVLFVARVLNVRPQQLQVEQVGHPQAASSHLVFVSGPMPREVVPIFTRPGAFSEASSIMRWYGRMTCARLLTKRLPSTFTPVSRRAADFLKEGNGIEHHTITDHAAAAGPQNAARHQLKYEFFSVDDDRVAGIVSAGIAGHDREIFGENVDDLAFTFVAPLRTYDDRSLTLLQCQLR